MTGTLTHDTSSVDELHERLYDSRTKIASRQRIINQARAMVEVIREDSPRPEIDQLLAILNKDPDQ